MLLNSIKYGVLHLTDIDKVTISKSLLLKNPSSIMFKLDNNKLEPKLLIEICKLLNYLLKYFIIQRLINYTPFTLDLEKTIKLKYYQPLVIKS